MNSNVFLTITSSIDPKSILLLLGLSFFFGLAYEDWYGRGDIHHPGGVRTFPMLSMTGVSLYILEPKNGILFMAGLVILGTWLLVYYQYMLRQNEQMESAGAGLMAPTCNLMAYILGPISLMEKTWYAVGITVAAVLFLSARDRLHDMARAIPTDEITSTGKFLILTGIVLPLLPDTPILSFTSITPYKVWLAVVVASGISYAGYLISRYKSKADSIWATSVLGGIYSSTATTVVLARSVARNQMSRTMFAFGTILVTSMMYIRLLAVIAAFNYSLAKEMGGVLIALFMTSVFIALLFYSLGDNTEEHEKPFVSNKNPLELTAALVFATIFVVVSIASSWVQVNFGDVGLYGLGAVVGISDISPFVVSLAQDQSGHISQHVIASSILIAASSNNLMKANYALLFAGWQTSRWAILALVILSLIGCTLPLYDLFSRFGH